MSDKDALAGTSTLTTRLLLRVVSDRGGEEAVERLLDRAGMPGDRDRLRRLSGRVPYSTKLQLFDAAVHELKDPRIGLALGRAAVADPALAMLRRVTTAFGSPSAVLRQVSRISTRLDSAAVFRCLSTDRGTAELVWCVMPPHHPTRVDCDYNIGMLMQVPVLFGLPPAVVDHSVCQVEGASECAYTVTWQGTGPARWWHRLGRRSAAPIPPQGCGTAAEQRLESLQEATTDLVSGDSLGATLDRVATRADRAVHAPGHVLDVTLPGGERHVRSRGLGASALAALGDSRLQPGCHRIGGTQVLAVPVTSATRDYGVLAVVAWPGQALFPGDADALNAYARHAAAAIEMTALLTEARDQEETARLLLSVARSLAGRRTARDIAQAVADAVPTLCGADRASVALWEPGAQAVWMAGLSGWPPGLAEQAAGYVTDTEESPELGELVATGAPMLVDRSSSDWARAMLEQFGVSAMGAVPIKADDRLVGIVLAHWVAGDPPATLGDGLAERLWGLAGLAGVALDNVQLLDEIRQHSLHDSLTSLANRALLEARLRTALTRPASPNGQVGLLFCDIRRLKRINDSLGHGAGDVVLQEVARRLRSVVREQDTVARYSGDEFVVLLPDATDRSVREVAARIHRSLSTPLSADGHDVFVDLAIGIAVTEAPAGEPDEAAQALVRRAAQDMDGVRNGGPVSPAGGDGRREGLRLETDLHGAVDRGEVEVHLQPQVEIATGRVVAVEALARWRHPDLGYVAPDVFVPIAEASGQIQDIGIHVMQEACRVIAGWRAEGLDLEVAVNVAAVQFTDPGFTDVVSCVLAQTGLPGARLTLEVTESQVFSEVAARHGHLERLRAMGIGLSVDDFGTGYSSLAQLHRLPVSEMKVDRAFTAGLHDGAPSPLVAGIVGLGHGLGLRVVAEGVETAAQLRALRAMGCERAQGYLFGRPDTPAALRGQLLAKARSSLSPSAA
ncbi:putative bifunctional diguanylate cyclase/phosphodiesterase [Blastococcus saxobsidens]|uniref:Diguanylate cyclase (GGDEF)-like protein n=1 Tax=Blastococcus saxobsidens TaxID=138336 RepID=A0A4Q7Y9C8_9ACTN|nr:EAL domain-containing protein [Blastococcus saxobsidens]RZU33727.1 diguanylate cyclase (GGDEF)-like protein [Blastococcus saxobsidens]